MSAPALRFAEGDRVKVEQARTGSGEKRVGSYAVIKHVGPFQGGDATIQLRENVWLEFASDYVVTYVDDGALGALCDWQLTGPYPADMPPSLVPT